MNARGGYSCAFGTCKNISGRTENKISFFRFPKDIERSKLWIEACGRQDLIKKTFEELHRNYRICALHFSQKMFLNDLRNRLQPSAIPIKEHNSQTMETISNDVIPNQSNCQEPLEAESAVIFALDHVQANTYVQNSEIQRKRDERDESILSESKGIQTDLNLSRNSPRKKLLRKKIVMLQKKIKRLQGKTNIKKIKIQDCNTIEYYLNLTDHFLPGPLAKFVKTQALLNQYLKKVPTDKYCILCMDEASLKANLFYNVSKDEVIGFEDTGSGKSFSPACNVAVLMIRGMYKSWKQPLGYYFLHSTFPADKLKNNNTKYLGNFQDTYHLLR